MFVEGLCIEVAELVQQYLVFLVLPIPNAGAIPEKLFLLPVTQAYELAISHTKYLMVL